MARTRSIDYDQKRESIKINSIKLFSDKGYHATSMSQVAASAAVSKGLLYHYYVNKEELLFDILYCHLTKLLNDVKAAINVNLTTEEQLEKLITSLLDNYDDKDREHLIQLHELPHLPIEKQKILRNLERQIVVPVHGVVEDLLEGSANKDIFAKPGTMTLFGIINWCFLWLRPDGNLTKQQYGKFVTKLFINGIKSF